MFKNIILDNITTNKNYFPSERFRDSKESYMNLKDAGFKEFVKEMQINQINKNEASKTMKCFNVYCESFLPEVLSCNSCSNKYCIQCYSYCESCSNVVCKYCSSVDYSKYQDITRCPNCKQN